MGCNLRCHRTTSSSFFRGCSIFFCVKSSACFCYLLVSLATWRPITRESSGTRWKECLAQSVLSDLVVRSTQLYSSSSNSKTGYAGNASRKWSSPAFSLTFVIVSQWNGECSRHGYVLCVAHYGLIFESLTEHRNESATSNYTTVCVTRYIVPQDRFLLSE